MMSSSIEFGLDFILSHFNQDRLFPRTIMTKNLGYQKEVFSKEEALRFFKESDFVDCRINAFPSYTEYRGIQRYPPDLMFIDLDRSNFKDDKSFENALSITLKNIKRNLINGGGYPTVNNSGNGYHIIQPIECPIVLEQIEEFQKYKNNFFVSQEFLRFAKDNLSKGKADKNNYPSFKSCQVRVPGSINSKYNRQVTVVQKWNGVRVPILREFLEDFRTHLEQKITDQENYYYNNNSNLKYNNNTNGNNINFPPSSYYYYDWIDNNILANPFSDYRKIIINLILAPYLIVIKKLSFEESLQIIKEWLQKCDLFSGRKLDFNPRSFVNTALTTVYKKQIPPMSIITLKTNYKDLYFLLVQKGKERK